MPLRPPPATPPAVAAANRIAGKFKWFDPTRGYGFVTSEEGSDSFVHISGFADEMTDEPEKGMGVTYELEPGRRGMQAVRVRPA